MRTLNHKKTTGIWLEFPNDPTFKLNIRPLNILSMNKPPTATETTQNEIWEWFNYILVDWSGYIDEESKMIECNEEMKKLVFNFDQDVVSFCIEQATKLRNEIVTVEEADNLKKSAGGEVANSAS